MSEPLTKHTGHLVEGLVWTKEKPTVLPEIPWTRETHSYEQIVARIMDKVEMVTESGCWVWVGATKGDEQYGVIYLGPRRFHVHSLLYKLTIGPIPEGLVPDHLCRVRPCVNPFHLEPVTNAVNIQRGCAPGMILHRLGICSHGHKMDEDNTRWYKGRGLCRSCERERSRRRLHDEVVNG